MLALRDSRGGRFYHIAYGLAAQSHGRPPRMVTGPWSDDELRGLAEMLVSPSGAGYAMELSHATRQLLLKCTCAVRAGIALETVDGAAPWSTLAVARPSATSSSVPVCNLFNLHGGGG